MSFNEELQFATESATLSPEARGALAEMLNKIGPTNVTLFVVVGHADDRLKPDAAQRLSMRRADATKEYLVSRGIDAALIYTEARGSSELADTSGTRAGRAKNHRVTVELVGTADYVADPSAWMPNNIVPVLYATNRHPTGSTSPFYFYGNKLAPDGGAGLEHGLATVRVPRERQSGDYKRPPSATLTIERIAKEYGLKDIAEGLLPNPNKHFIFAHQIKVLERDQFQASLKGAVLASKSRTAVLYVHGYNNDFTDAAFRTAQIVYDMAEPDYDLVPLMFSWPSDPGLIGFDYGEAASRTDTSAEALTAFLRTIAEHTEIGTVHIVAHSMGSRVLASALTKLGATQELTRQRNGANVPVFKHIVFAAADIEPSTFETLIAPAIRGKHTITSYVSSKDRVLLASWARNWTPRLGFGAKYLPKCVDTIDATEIGSGLAHSTWADTPRVIKDLRTLIRHGTAPARRGLAPRSRTAYRYWAFERTPVEVSADTPDAAPPMQFCATL